MRKTFFGRILWPVIFSIIGLIAHAFQAEAFASFSLNEQPQGVRVILAGLCYFSLAWLGGRLVGVVLGRGRQDRRRAPKLLQDLLSAAFFLIALIATLTLVLGQSASGALASSGLILAVVGFAIRNVVADVLSGVALGVEGPFRIGDSVDIHGLVKGRVVEIGWRTTRVLTRDSTYMALPNSVIARQVLTNFSAPKPQYRAQVEVTLDHGTPASRAREILSTAAAQSPLIRSDHPTDVRLLAYEPDGIVYAVRYWIGHFDDDIDCRDSVLSEIDRELRIAGVPPPHRHVRASSEGSAPYAVSAAISL
ncbi:small-conductance mechanosensitive channel [Constrictibacter sp. MBR-5]|jgi:small-conductance mechanosensitive channel|uniref:mechanosensitive ion channel family protein n=1 Tax=Constrictibacter sp. MBR-5 TaxID=3156467 RepID=UPI003394EDEC